MERLGLELWRGHRGELKFGVQRAALTAIVALNMRENLYFQEGSVPCYETSSYATGNYWQKASVVIKWFGLLH